MKIASSILSADFLKLGEEIEKISKTTSEYIHIDIMDGHFVPNITFGPSLVKMIRSKTDLVFDVHLMIENPENYIDKFVEAGADIISVHVESAKHLNRLVRSIKEKGIKASVAINPATPLNSIEWVLEELDMVLLMSVNPGFGGQKFIQGMCGKISALKEMILKKGLNVEIEVDGGIDTSNAAMISKAGADVLVSGAFIFNSSNIGETIDKLRNEATLGIR